MIKLLQLLFLGHSHKWVVIQQGEIVRGGNHYGTHYQLQCESCGNIKTKDCFVSAML